MLIWDCFNIIAFNISVLTRIWALDFLLTTVPFKQVKNREINNSRNYLSTVFNNYTVQCWNLHLVKSVLFELILSTKFREKSVLCYHGTFLLVARTPPCLILLKIVLLQLPQQVLFQINLVSKFQPLHYPNEETFAMTTPTSLVNM